MNRQHGRKIISGFLVFSFMLSFSFTVFADAFTGAYMTTVTDPVTGQVTTVIEDVNPTGETFTGQNVIEINAYNNAPVLTNNTFNGSTDISPDFTSITSTGNAYNGSVDIDYSGLGGTLDSNGDRFQSTTLTANSSDVSISNGTFNGNTTINAQSVSLGSITQMDSLLDGLYSFYYSLTQSALTQTNSAVSVTCPWTGNSLSIPRTRIVYRYMNYVENSNTSPTVTTVQYYGFFMDMIQFLYSCIPYSITSLGLYIGDKIDALLDYVAGNGSWYMYTFSASGEYYSISGSNQTVDFREVIKNRLDIIVELLKWFTSRFYEWYYPLDNVLPEYWRYYNTDTAQQEDISLAGLMYNISWYLGQMYVLQAGSDALDNMQDQVEAVTEVFEDAEEAEQDIMDSISTGISSFNPDISELGAFAALGWCSNYLQLCFLRLGTYGTVILIGLLLGVCMQFIGYFRYKT